MYRCIVLCLLFIAVSVRAEPVPLRPPAAFHGAFSGTERAQALFREASRVFLHPRCVNCHPSDDVPLQGDSGTPHEPPVWRGRDDKGIPGLECASCHQDRNAILARVPGAPAWHLASLSMAWAGRGMHDVCEAIKDPTRNGGKTLAQIVEHVRHDPLVGWGWDPGANREAVPGPRQTFGDLVEAWVAEGAVCP